MELISSTLPNVDLEQPIRIVGPFRCALEDFSLYLGCRFVTIPGVLPTPPIRTNYAPVRTKYAPVYMACAHPPVSACSCAQSASVFSAPPHKFVLELGWANAALLPTSAPVPCGAL